MLDGFAVAAWNALKGNVTVEPLRRRPRVERSAIEDERERLATFLAD